MEKDKKISLKEMAAASQFNKERDYWLTRLSGELVKSSFPPDFQYPVSQTPEAVNKNMQIVKFCFEGDLFARLMKLRNGLDSTLHMVLVAGITLLLEKYTGHNDIIVGTTILKQENDANFINTVLALRNRLEPRMTFKDLLLQVRQTLLEAVMHQNYPLEKLLYQLDIPVVEGSFPLFDTGVILQNIHDRNYFGRIDLNMLFSFLRNQECLEGTLEYQTAVYDRSSMQRLVEHFTYLMNQAVFNLDMELSQVQVLSPQEIKQITWDFNAAETDYPAHRTVHELFAGQVEKTPFHTAIIHKDRTFTLKQVDESAHRLANYLYREKGIGPDHIVGILMNNSPELVITMLGVLKAGGAYVPLDPSLPAERMRFILKDAQVKIVISLGSYLRILERSDMTWRGIPSAGGHQLAYMIYTSGTTGKPRGVMIEHRSLVNYLCWAIKQYTGPGISAFPLYTTPAFDLTVTSIYLPLLTGSPLIIYEQDTQAKGKIPVQEVIEHNAVDLVKATPSHLKMLQYTYINSTGDMNRDNSIRRSRVRTFIVGGEELTSELARAVYRDFHGQVDIYNEYGPTEATVGCMIYKFNDTTDTRRGVPIGVPVDNVKIYLLDANLNPVPIGATGEIYVGGDALARGYLNLPELTAEKFIKNPYLPATTHASRLYKTGDLACLLPGGILEYTGRKDEQVKIRGYRVEIKDIESRLLGLKKIDKVVVTAQNDEGGETYLCAYYEAQEEVEITEIRGYLAIELPDYMIPSYFVRIDRIPLTLNGKIDKKALAGIKITGSRGSRHKYIPPGNQLEEILVDIWSRVLKIDKETISIDADFFELGGHSLRATIVVSNIHKELNVKVPLVEIFKAPTIRTLAGYLDGKTKDRFISIPPAEEMEYYALSPAQRRLYFLQQMKEGNIVYNVYAALELAGKVDKNKLEETFKKLIARHDSLRTYFMRVGDEIVQRIAPVVEFCVDYTEVEGKGPEEIMGRVIRPFSLEKAPLLRVKLVRFDKERYWMIYDMHHIITDGTSMAVLVKEFAALYAGELLESLRIQYKDFSQWQNSAAGKDALKRQESYWIGEYPEAIPMLELYTDYPRPAIQEFAGDRIHFILGENETLALKTCALKQEVTLFMLLLGVYNVLLSRLSGQEDIVVGTPVAGRRHADLQHIIGMFVNTLALRNYPVGNRRFIDFLKELKDRTLGAFENQEYPFEELVEKVTVQRAMGRNPLFDTIFSVQNMESQVGIPEARMADIELRQPEFPLKIAKFDLSMHVNEAGDVLVFTLEYSTALFKKETVERFYGYFIKAALAAAVNPLKNIIELEIISNEEKERILYIFNDTKVEYPREKTIHRLFEEQAEKSPDRMALSGELGGPVGCAGHAGLSYSELNVQSHRLAGLLITKGVLPGDIVAIKMARSIGMVIAILGTLKSGGAYMPIDPDYPQERIDYMLKDSNARILINKSEARISKFETNSNGRNPNRVADFNFSNLAYIIYTSGSTGKPKGVMVEHRSVIRLVINNDFVEFSERLRVLQTGAPVFDAVTFEMWGPLLNGGQLYLVDNEVLLDPGKLGKALLKYLINTMWLTSSLFNQLAHQDGNIFSKLEWLVVGGDVLSPGYIAEVRRQNNHLKVVNGYGPTENTTFSVCHRIDRDYPNNIPIGKPIANSCAYILDKNGRLQPQGVPGELYVGGDGLARGYLNNPELTAGKFNKDLWDYQDKQDEKNKSFAGVKGGLFQKPPLITYKTGDLARWLPGGVIEFLGRSDYQIKIRGFRVELGEIKNRLASHEEIKEIVVTVANNEGPNGDKSLCAYFTAQRELDVAELREYLGRELPGYMVPAYFIQLQKMPLTRNGKVDRGALPVPRFKTGNEFVAPVDEIEAQIVEIWSKVLGIKKEVIGIHDDFFHLGGHSLKAMLLALQAAKIFNVKFSLTDVFTGSTVKEMAAVIRQGRKRFYEEIKPVEKREYYPQSSAQKRLFFLEQFENIGTTYNISSVLKIEGKLDFQQFRQAIKKIIQRHETLRTSFKIIHNEPVQIVHDHVDFEIDNYTGSQVEEKIRDFNRPFDLSRAPLLRIGLISLPGEINLLLYDLHHIIGDGTSMGILIDDFATFYDGNELSSLQIQYKDFTDWQNDMIKTHEIEKQEKYWLNVFAKEIPKLNFPTDYPRPENLSFKGDRYFFIVESEVSDAIHSLAVENRATLFMVMLAAFNAFLYKYSGQSDIIVGTGIMGRHHADLQRSIGMFVNSLAIRNYPSGEKTFLQFLSEVRENSICAFANQDVQFEELVDKLKLPRDNSRNPLFDVILVVQNYEQAKFSDLQESELKDLKILPYRHENKTAKFDLNLAIWEVGRDIHFILEYATALFKPETIAEIMNNYTGILKQIIKKRDILLDELIIANDLLEVRPNISEMDKTEFTF